MSFQLEPFNSGLQKGVRVYFFSAPGDKDHKEDVFLDIRDFFHRGFISRIGSIQLYNQYATIGIQDWKTGIWRYSNASTQTCFPVNTKGDKFQIKRYDNLAQPASFELIIFEDTQPAYSIGAALP